jgi:hypothetical protein
MRKFRDQKHYKDYRNATLRVGLCFLLVGLYYIIK